MSAKQLRCQTFNMLDTAVALLEVDASRSRAAAGEACVDSRETPFSTGEKSHENYWPMVITETTKHFKKIDGVLADDRLRDPS